jgi:hypothetical protein
MQHGIVEGEPGIFPEPVARLMRGIGRLFGGRKRSDEPAEPAEPREMPKFPERPPDAPS